MTDFGKYRTMKIAKNMENSEACVLLYLCLFASRRQYVPFLHYLMTQSGIV